LVRIGLLRVLGVVLSWLLQVGVRMLHAPWPLLLLLLPQRQLRVIGYTLP
jgi:hypothetical protein